MNPRYFYFRYIFNFVGLAVGNGYGKTATINYWDSFNMLNMHLYPSEVKMAI